jgi:hypothetical protein
MPVSVSAKRPEGNDASDVERPLKRSKLSADPSEEDKSTEVPDTHTAVDAGPSDLYLDTVGSTY